MYILRFPEDSFPPGRIKNEVWNIRTIYLPSDI